MDQADAITDATGNARIANSIKVLIAAYQGELGASTLIEGALCEAAARGDGVFLTYLEYATAVLHNGLGLYDGAMGAAQRASAQDHLSHSTWALPELVEAAARAGNVQIATTAVQDLSARTRQSNRLGVLAKEERDDDRGTSDASRSMGATIMSSSQIGALWLRVLQVRGPLRSSLATGRF